MKHVDHQRIRVISEQDPQVFEAKYNQITDDLKQYKVNDQIYFDNNNGFCAIIKYITRELIPESLSEEFGMQGIRYYCKDCPRFQKAIKAKKRVKRQSCEFSESGTVVDFTPACNDFYKKVLDGKIVPEVK